MSSDTITQSDWVKGIGFSILSSIFGGASKLAIRKSWLIEEECRNLTTGDFMLLVDVSRHMSDQVEVDVGENANVSSFRIEENNTCPYVSSDRANAQQSPSRYTDERQTLHDSADNSSEQTERVSFRGVQCVSSGIDSRLAQTREKMALKKLYRAYVLRGMGTLGMTTLNPLTTVIAMNYASPSILAPFSGLTLVWIIMFSPLVVGETPNRRQLLACVFILLGEVVVAAFGDHKNDNGVTVDDVVQSYFRAKFLLFFFGLSAWMLVLSFVISAENVSPALRRFAWGVSGGSVTGFQNFLKDALTVLKASSSTSDKLLGIPIPPPLFFVLMFGAISAAIGGLLLLIQCMKRYDATYSSAMFVGSFVVSASIMSALHYDTFSNLHGLLQYVLYPTGLVLLIIGIVLLAAEPESNEEEISDNDDFQISQHSTHSEEYTRRERFDR